jgi:pyrroline-5-carboxylate reductase
MNRIKLGFIGCGNMATAIIKGIIRNLLCQGMIYMSMI